MKNNQPLSGKQKAKQVFQYWAIYTAVWFLFAVLILLIFHLNGRSFLWFEDGVYQHFPAFQYLCDSLDSLIRGNGSSAAFRFTLGQGADILTTLNSYDFTDPVCLAAALVYPLSRYARYVLMIFAKLYLIGAAFSFFCSVTGIRKKSAILCGAITYTFSGAVLFMFARHPNYINWAYFLPLLLAGVELYRRRGRKLPLLLFVIWNVITSYYTFYMNVILVILYVLVRVLVYAFSNNGRDGFGTRCHAALKQALKTAGVFLLGMLLSMPVLLPTVYAFLHNARVLEATGYTASLLAFPAEYYRNLLYSFFSIYSNGGYGTFIGLAGVVLVPLVIVFTVRRRYIWLKVLLPLGWVLLCIPAFSRLMNGWGYAVNRWSYAVVFLACAAFAAVFDQILDMGLLQKILVAAVSVLYLGFCVYMLLTGRRTVLTIGGPAVLLVSALAVLLGSRLPRQARTGLLVAVTMLGVGVHIFLTFSPAGGNYAATFLTEAGIREAYDGFSLTAVPGEDSSFYRVESEEGQANLTGIPHVNGTDIWWSLLSSDTAAFYNGMQLDSVVQNCYFEGLDGRIGLMALAGVRYYTAVRAEDPFVPYGYRELPVENYRFQIFENPGALPVGYSFREYLRKEEFDALNGIEKEQALLQAVVLEEVPEGFEELQPVTALQELSYELAASEGVLLEQDILEAASSAAYFTIRTDVPDDCGLFVSLEGFRLGERRSDVDITVTRTTGTYTRERLAKITNSQYSWAVFRDGVLYQLGYGHPGETQITFRFSKSAEFSYDAIQVIAVPVSLYDRYIAGLSQYALQSVSVGKDQISGQVSFPESRILQLAVPYSDGWSASIDGQKTRILKSDLMYLSLIVPAGDHVIELRYHTPYLLPGILAALVTLIGMLGYEMRKRKSGSQ